VFLLLVLGIGLALILFGAYHERSERARQRDREELGLRIDTNSLDDDPVRRREIAERRWR
jgi:hypothetical protein